MRIKKYYRATSLEDASQAIKKHQNSTVVAGGAWLKLLSKEVDLAVGLDDLNLDTIKETDTHIQIGSMATLNAIERHPSIRHCYGGILSKALRLVMGVPFRNLATIGGSVMGRFPFSDIITPLLTMDVTLVFYPQQLLSLEAFLAEKPSKEAILEKIIIKKAIGQSYFHKVSTTHLDFAIVNVAITRIDQTYAIAIGARPGIAQKANKAMAFLNRHQLAETLIDQTVDIACEELVFGSNHLAQAAYRKQCAQTYLKRGLLEVMQDGN